MNEWWMINSLKSWVKCIRKQNINHTALFSEFSFLNPVGLYWESKLLARPKSSSQNIPSCSETEPSEFRPTTLQELRLEYSPPEWGCRDIQPGPGAEVCCGFGRCETAFPGSTDACPSSLLCLGWCIPKLRGYVAISVFCRSTIWDALPPSSYKASIQTGPTLCWVPACWSK